jgi:ethanolamine utilization microcompartment shell protein EutS
MRSILQNNALYDSELKVGIRIGSVHQTISATYNMTQDQPVQLNVIASGANRTVVLPSILGTTGSVPTVDKRLHIVANVGTSNSVQVNAHADDSSTAVATLAPGEAVMVVSDLADDVWVVIGGGVGAGGLDLPDGANIALGTTTGTEIGTTTTQKVGFYGTTPVVQQAAITTVTTAANTTASTTTTPFGYATSTQANAVTADIAALTVAVNAIITELTSLGLIA